MPTKSNRQHLFRAHKDYLYTCVHLILELLLSEPRIGHVLLHVVVILVVLVVALRPRPERHQERRVAQVSHKRVDPRVVAERCVAAVVALVGWHVAIAVAGNVETEHATKNGHT